jgi:hypothetical protein
VLRQLRGQFSVDPRASIDRRARPERRHLSFWSVLYGGFRPRRRHSRRLAETALPVVDWHESHLLAVAIAILLLCVGDGALTVTLLMAGASELNPIMEKLLSIDVMLFHAAKVALTGIGIGVLVLLSRLRLFGRVRVVQSLYAVLLIYVLLVAYELTILSSF